MRTMYYLLTLSLITLMSCNSGVSEKEAINLISKDEIMKNVLVLSADEMEGRAPGTEGEQKAAQFIAGRFKENGLQAVNGSYFQKFNLIGSKKNAEKSSLKISSKTKEIKYIPNETLTYRSSSLKDVIEIKDAPLIFVGYGVEAPEYNWDDFKGEDVSGKVLLFLNNDPPVREDGRELFKGEARTYYGRWTYKFEQAMKKGAAGAIIIHTTPSASYGFSVIGNSGAKESFAIDLPGSGYQVDLISWINEEHSNEIATAMGTDLNGLFEMAKERSFKPVDTGFKVNAHIETVIRKVETQNVMALLPGSDPELQKEFIVFSAHYDHLGVVESVEGDDKIYNGAWDNALGTSCIINMSKAYTLLADKPKRSLLFLACAAEESGSLGSAWFANNPPVAQNKIVANFNIDMPQIFGVTSDLSVIGLNMNSLGDIIRNVVNNFTVNVDDSNRTVKLFDDLNPNAGTFYRSDQINFAKAGIPALYVKPGKNYVTGPTTDPQAYRASHYHQVTDEVNEAWDLSGCVRDMQIIFKTGLTVANQPEMPRWNPGNEFEDAWKKLHGITE